MRTKVLRVAAALAVVAAALSAPSAAHALPAYALTDNNFLLKFDTAAPSVLTGVGPILDSSNNAVQDLLGIDFRPTTGQMYAVGAGLALYTINPNTAVATQVGTLSADAGDLSDPFTGFSGSRFGLDFEPVSDGANFFALHVTSNTGQFVRVNLGDGKVITNAPTGNSLVDLAYNPALPQPFAIDPVTDQLMTVTGMAWTNVGPLGLDVSALGGFDIVFDGVSTFAYAALQDAGSGVSRFYTINLTTGAASLVGTIDGGEFIDGLTVAIPEPAGLALAGLAGAALLFRRWRGNC